MFWPKLKCVIPGNILMHTRLACCVPKAGYLKAMEFYYFIME